MRAHLRRTRASVRLTAVAAAGLLATGLITAVPASAAPVHQSAGRPQQAPHANAVTQRPAPLTPLAPVDPGADGTNVPASTGSPADTAIAPLPAFDPGPNDSPTVPEAPVTQQLPVTPSPITLPTQPGQTLVDATAADALNTMAAAGPYVSGNAPAIDANKLQPQVSSAQSGFPPTLATIQQLAAALASGNIPPPLPIDPLALLQQLPNGIPQLTYRLCSVSASKPTSCSLTLPLGVPALLNVTGNGTPASPDSTPDELVDLVPIAGVANVVSAAQTLLGDQGALATAQTTLTNLLLLLQNPAYLLTHPGALVQVLNLQKLTSSLRTQIQHDLGALTTLVNVGVALVQLRLPTSEIPVNQPIKAHVWAVYDIPGHHRLSVGIDGYQRGDGLPQDSIGMYTISPAAVADGVYDVQAQLYSSHDSTAAAITAGISSITTDSTGAAYDPTVASIRLAPVPAALTAHAVIDPSSGTDSVQATTDRRIQLDALIFSNHHSSAPTTDQYLQVKIDTLPKSVSAILHRDSDGTTQVTYNASDTIDAVLFADYQYTGGSTLDTAMQAQAFGVPATFGVNLATGDDTSLTYTASSSLATLGLDYYVRSASIGGSTGPLVARGALTGLPTSVSVLMDGTNKHADLSTNAPLAAAALSASYQLGSYAPLTDDHVTFIKDGTAFGVDGTIHGLTGADVYYDNDPRFTLAFTPGGQAFTAAGLVDGHLKFRGDISNLPATLSGELNTVTRKLTYDASDTIDRITAAYVDTTDGPSIAARIDSVPTSVNATWDLGDAPHVNYQASAAIPLVNFFASPQGVETVDAYGDEYLSAAVTDIPKTVDLLLDFPNSHVAGTSSDALGSVTVAARAPFDGREWTAVGGLTNVPAKFTADFADGNYDFHALSGPLGSATLTVSNHGDPLEPTSPAHLAVHYDQVSGDLDASAAILALTEIGYANSNGDQRMVLQADESSNPLQVDANVQFAANGVADTQLTALGSITGLPSNVNITMADGKITYSADKHVGIQLGVRAGKVAALAGLGAPLPANGIAAVARSCASGPGCASDSSPFCSAFASCLGAVGNINMSGLPTSAVVNLSAGTVSFTGYQPPSSTLTLYVRLIGLIASLPDAAARALLSGLPSSLDFTAGPFAVGAGDPSVIDARYQASAPLGSLTMDVDATTTNASFPVLRANATITDLPQSMHMTASFGSATHLTFADSAGIPSVTARVTSDTTGYLSANVSGVPATADVLVDVPSSHAEATMSSPIDAITLVAHVPYQGRTWNAYAQAADVPGHFTADFGAGTYGFKALSGPLGSATFAVSNHAGATVPNTADYLAVHYDQLSGDLDAGASISQLSDVEYSKAGDGDQTFGLDMGAATVGLDANIVLAANGARDTRYAAGGTITTPNSVHVDVSNGHIVYQADQSAALALTAAIGKVSALSGLGAPLYPQGVAARARSCTTGPGCANDSSIFCSVFSSCFGAVANVNLPGLPTKVDIDTQGGTVNIVGLHPSGDLKVFGELDGLISSLPQVRALATLTGLPNPLDITVGPFGNDRGDPTKIVGGYSANQGFGSLTVDADAQTTTSLGTVRGQLFASNLPETFSVNGTFGSATHIHVANSDGIGELRVQATATLQGSPGSGLVDFTDVPAHLDMDVGAVGTGNGINVPTFTYSSPDSTLDGLVQLDATLTQNAGPATVGTNGAFFKFTNLGGDTKVTVDTSTYNVQVVSTPATDLFQLGANLFVNDIPNTDFSKQIFDELATQGYVEGHYGARPSSIDDIEIVMTDVSALKIQPGNAPFGLPALVGLLFPGVSGSYGTFSLYTNGVNLHPDVEVKFRINDPLGDDHYPVDVSLPTNITDLWFHRFDDNGPKEIANIDLGVACISFKINPEDVGKSDNFVTLDGSDGPQTFNFLDINDEVPDWLVWLVGAYTSPFMSLDLSTDLSLGSC